MTPEMPYIPKRMGTKEYIICVFRELLKRESFDTLSVQSIAASCGLSRTTFYRFFQDKDDLLIWSCIQQFGEISAQVSSEKDRLSRVLELMYCNRQYFKKVLKSDRGQRVLEDFIFQRSVRSLHTRLLQESGLQCLPAALLTKIEFCCAGAQYITKKWLLGNTGESPDEIAGRILDCFPEPIRGYCLVDPLRKAREAPK